MKKASVLNSKSPRVALVYDWLDTKFGGAEKVIQALHELYPQAPLYVAYQTHQAPAWAKKLTIKTSFLQKHLWLCRFKPLIAAFLPLAFESFNFDNYDTVISVSSFSAKGIITKPHQTHYCYLLTPTRFLHSHPETYATSRGLLRLPPFKQIYKAIYRSLLKWDRIAAYRPDFLIPISGLIALRTKKYYQRSTTAPLYPPVDDQRLLHLAKQNQALSLVTASNSILSHLPFTKFDLIVARHVKYKRVDLALKSAVQAKRPLVIVGTGELTINYQLLAKKIDPKARYLYFAGNVSNQDLVFLYQNAELFLMPGLEDFGITGLEAQLFGLPVLVHHQSGVAELITHQQTGFHLEKETITEIMRGYEWYENNHHLISSAKITKNSLKYSLATFKHNFQNYVNV